jgi:hypothetical protein
MGVYVIILASRIHNASPLKITFHVFREGLKEYKMKYKFLKTALVGSILSSSCLTNVANASLITLSTIDPIVNEADIALLPGDTTTLNPNNDTSAIWSDRPDQGQTFTTSSNGSGYEMKGFSFLHSFPRGWNISTLTLNIGTINPTTNLFSSIFADVIAPASTPTAPSGSSWFNFELDNSIFLDALTEYAVFVGNPDGLGAVFMQSAVDTDYTGGSAYRDRVGNGTFDENLAVSSHGFDRIFHVDLLAVEVPEPSTLAIWGLGLMVLVSRRFKKQA